MSLCISKKLIKNIDKTKVKWDIGIREPIGSDGFALGRRRGAGGVVLRARARNYRAVCSRLLGDAPNRHIGALALLATFTEQMRFDICAQMFFVRV
jgi:hypothetical protein